MSAYARSAEIIRRLKLELPIDITLEDPLSGLPFHVKRDNVLAMLTVDTANILFEGQSYAAIYLEMGRAQRAAEKMAAKAAIEYRAWQAQISAAHRELKAASGKKTTEAECEEQYRIHPEYEKRSMREKHFLAVAGLFEDAKEAFSMKGYAISNQIDMLKGYERAEQVDDGLDRFKELESLEAETEAAYETAKRISSKGKRTPRELPEF